MLHVPFISARCPQGSTADCLAVGALLRIKSPTPAVLFQVLPQCAVSTLHFDDLTMLVPINPLTGMTGEPGTAGYTYLPGNYSDTRLTWTNWDVIDGVQWGQAISDPKDVRHCTRSAPLLWCSGQVLASLLAHMR